MTDFAQWLSDAYEQEQRAIASRQVLEAASNANAELDDLRQSVAHTRKELDALEAQRTSLVGVIAGLVADKTTATESLASLRDEIGRVRAKADADHAERLARFDAELSERIRTADAEHQARLAEQAAAILAGEQEAALKLAEADGAVTELEARRDELKAELAALKSRFA